MIVVLPRLKETRFQLEKTPEVMEDDVLIKKKNKKIYLVSIYCSIICPLLPVALP
jgi:hypothetical protein